MVLYLVAAVAAVLLLNLGDAGAQRLLFIGRRGRGLNLFFLLSHVQSSFPAGVV